MHALSKLDFRLGRNGLRRLTSYSFVIGNRLFDAMKFVAAQIGRVLDPFGIRYRAVAAFKDEDAASPSSCEARTRGRCGHRVR